MKIRRNTWRLPSIPESHKNQECISKRYSTGKDAVSCQRKRSQEMDTEISELGSGVESVDCLVWRTAYQLSVEKRKAGMDLLQS